MIEPSRPCDWALRSPLEQDYHDREWGVPQTDDRVLFEFLLLESAQAGLSWRTVLEKRAGYRRHYGDFDPERVARFGEPRSRRCWPMPASSQPGQDRSLDQQRPGVSAPAGTPRSLPVSLALCGWPTDPVRV